MHPIDVPTRQTVEFIQSQVRRGAHILEIGCGDGEVALALSRNGFEVTALDADPERIAKARDLGVNAVVASWPDFETDPIDAIVFTRSLHHMNRLAESIERARSVLMPNGLLLIDDFAVESATDRTLAWFRDLVQSEPFASVAQPHPDSFVAKLVTAQSPLETFRDHHVAHEVHPFALMHQLIAERFPNCSVQPAPYLYRYFASMVGETNEHTGTVDEFLRREIEVGEQSRITLIGRRMIAVASRQETADGPFGSRPR